MTLTQRDSNLQVVVGDPAIEPSPRSLFDEPACRLLAALGDALRRDARARRFSDLQTFAFWCRSANIKRLKASYATGDLRLGRGLVFHIAPGNVPVNAAFTFAFGLLAGNANIVRLPSRDSRQLEIFCDVLGGLFLQQDHAAIARSTALVRYPHDAGLTERFSARCQARMIWGGDETIRTLRQTALPPRAVELTFANRYSFCVMQADAVLSASEFDLARLAEGFYNDTYAMDQNACSSPNLVLWQGSRVEAAKERFWRQLASWVEARYDLSMGHAVEKYSRLLDAAITNPPAYFRRHDNNIYVMGAGDLAGAAATMRGRFGLFYEKEIDSLDDVIGVATSTCQTLTYFGFDKAAACELMVRYAPMGIDRIVPVGRALDMDVVWDGHDIIRGLSRLVDVK